MEPTWKNRAVRVDPEASVRQTPPAAETKWHRSATRVEPSLSEKANAAFDSAVGSFSSSTAVTTGAVAGAMMGAPFLGPFGSAAGALLLGTAGYLLEDAVTDNPEVEDFPPELRPYAVAGEVFGGGLPMVGGTLGVAKAGARLAPTTFGNFINRMLDTAARNPVTFTSAEVSGLTGAATAGAVSEAYLPGNTGARVASEVAGGFFNPTRLLSGMLRGTVDTGKLALSAMSLEGRTSAASGALQRLVENAGEDPVALAKALRATPTVKMTSAQLTGSPALAALERKLAEESRGFGHQQEEIANSAIESVKSMITALRGDGSPAALKAAAQMRDRYFRGLIATRLKVAEETANAAARNVARESPMARAPISRHTRDLVRGALDDARAVERELWDQVPRDGVAHGTSMLARYGDLRNEMLRSETLPQPLEDFMRQLMDDDGAATAGELMRFRSRALQLARDAGRDRAWEARAYGVMAEAALDDLGAMPNVSPAFDDARSFSRALNETFSRTFAGDVLAHARGGRDRIPADMVMRFAIGDGGERTALRLRQIEEAMRFLPDRGLSPRHQLDEMLELQSRALRLAASESVDPITGRVSTARLGRFMNEQSAVLDHFPELRTDLQRAVDTEAGLQKLQNIAKGATRSIDQRAAFARISRVENPVDAVRRAIAGENPVRDIGAFARLAKRGGPEAVEGLKASVWDDAIIRSTKPSGDLDADALFNHMFKSIRPGQPSLMTMMERDGIITAADSRRVKKLYGEIKRIETAMASGKPLEELVTGTDPVFDLSLRVAGAELGGAMSSLIPGGGSGHGLIAAGAGSRFARNLFAKVPIQNTRDLLIQAATDPEFAALLLERPSTRAGGLKLARQMHAYLLESGLLGIEDLEAED